MGKRTEQNRRMRARYSSETEGECFSGRKEIMMLMILREVNASVTAGLKV